METKQIEPRLYAGGHHARFIDEHTPLHIVSKTFQDRFLLVPNAELNTLIKGVIGRAQHVYPAVALHAIAFMSNHMHAIVTGPADQIAGFIGFIKREISRRWGGEPDVNWRGGMWSGGSYLAAALPTHESQIRTLEYVLSQGVKEDLVDRPQDWPGVNCAHALTLGRSMQGNWLDATAFARAKQLEARRKNPRPIRRADFIERYEVKLTPIAAWSKLDAAERQQRARELVDRICQRARARRQREGIMVLGRARVIATSRNVATRASLPPWFETRRRMIVWADARHPNVRAYLQRYWAFQDAFRRASRFFLAGELDAPFPAGAFRPPSWCPPQRNRTLS